MGTGTKFEWQHDARRRPDGSISLYDHGSSPQEEPRSRGLVLRVDEAAGSATLLRQYTNGNILSSSQGNLQLLPNRNAFIGFGSQPNFSEFDFRGETVFDAKFLTANQSYRMFRQLWAGKPLDLPAVAVTLGAGSRRTVYASWNGSTAVARWEVMAGTTPQSLAAIGSAARSGFVTAITVSSAQPYLAVRALDETGNLLATRSGRGMIILMRRVPARAPRLVCLGALTLMLEACTLSGAAPAAPASSPTRASPVPAAIHLIKHVIVIQQENRSCPGMTGAVFTTTSCPLRWTRMDTGSEFRAW
jgi:hypothetical protein